MPYRWDIETLRQSDLLGDGNGAEAVGGDNVPHVSLKPLAFEWAGAMVRGHVEQYWAVFRSRERNCLMLHGISWVSSIFGFVCTLFAHFCGVPFLWSFRSEVKLSRLSHRVMKSHYFKHAEQQANWLHLSARNADALEQERTIAISSACNWGDSPPAWNCRRTLISSEKTIRKNTRFLFNGNRIGRRAMTRTGSSFRRMEG